MQKTSANNFAATLKLTFEPTSKYKGKRTELIVMGTDYAGLILENTDKGLVLSQVSCPKAGRGTPEETNATVNLKDGTVCLKARFSTNGSGWADIDWFRITKK